MPFESSPRLFNKKNSLTSNKTNECKVNWLDTSFMTLMQLREINIKNADLQLALSDEEVIKRFNCEFGMKILKMYASMSKDLCQTIFQSEFCNNNTDFKNVIEQLFNYHNNSYNRI